LFIIWEHIHSTLKAEKEKKRRCFEKGSGMFFFAYLVPAEQGKAMIRRQYLSGLAV
jgi:hypothetical protein